jgi:hypothetical protein
LSKNPGFPRGSLGFSLVWSLGDGSSSINHRMFFNRQSVPPGVLD